jgi:4-hydroxy-3-polyprenylbenzoate decarboxylase
MTREKQIISLRSALDWLKDELKVIKGEVDPVLEAAAISKAFDDGPVFLAENLTGYPHARMVINFWGKKQRTAKVLGVDDYKQAKFKVLEAVKNPIPPREVKVAPCQEVVISKDKVVPFDLFPMVKHTEADGGRFFGSGVYYIGGKYCDGGSQLSLYRMSFRGKDYASINMVPGGHGDRIAMRFSKEKIPVTINICPPPTVEFMGMSSFFATLFPNLDEVAIAGALQGSPVEIVKAKTVDAYAIANAEWVIEGYIVPYERIWETEEAERLGQQGVAPFHPEWPRYIGRAYRSRKFELTTVTKRKDKPIYFYPHGGEGLFPGLSASWYELGERIAPGFVIDVNNAMWLTTWGAVIFQVRKSRRSDEGLQRNLLAAALGLVRGLRLAIVVDEDVNIYDPEDVIWALITRVDPNRDIVRGISGRGQAYQPAEREAGAGTAVSAYEGGIGIDATVPLAFKEQFRRAKFSVDKVDFKKWFTDDEIKTMKAQQGDYFRWLGEVGFA